MRALGTQCWLLVGFIYGCGEHAATRSGSGALGRSTHELVVISAEIGTDAPVPVPSNLGYDPALATDGQHTLAVFEVDERIRAVRVDENGTLLNLDWIDLGEAARSQHYPSVAFGGDRYLVTWSEFETDGPALVRGRFVGRDGQVEGSESFALSEGEGIYSSVAWNGEQFVAAWLGLEGQGSNNVRAALFQPDGTKVASSEHALSTSGAASAPRLAVGTGTTLVAWEEAGDTRFVYAARVGPNGAPLEQGKPLSGAASSASDIAIASSGAGFLVGWRSRGTPDSIRGAVVDEDGATLVPDFAISHATGNTGVPSIAFDGEDYLVAWPDERDGQSMVGVKVSPAGSVSSTTDHKLAEAAPRSVSSDRTALSWNGSRYLLAFVGNGVQGSVLGQDLSILSASTISAIAHSQGTPQATWDGQNYVVAWTDERVSTSAMSIRAVRINGSGVVLDPAGLELSLPGQHGFSVSLASVANDRSLLVGTSPDQATWFRSIANSGMPSEQSPLSEQPVSTGPALAASGDGYLAVFRTNPFGTSSAILGRLFDQNGTASAEFPIDTSASNSGPSVIPADDGFLVSYGAPATQVVPVGVSGELGEAFELSPGLAYLAGATNGTNTLLVWTESANKSIQGRWYQAGAFSEDAFTIAADSAGYSAAVAWDSSNYWVVWEAPARGGLEGRTVGAEGTLGEIETLVADDTTSPQLASDGQGQLLLSYVKWGEHSRNRRVVSRLLGRGADVLPPNGGTGGASGAGGSAGGTDGETAGEAGQPSEGGANGSPIAGANNSGGSTNPSAGGTSIAGNTAAAGSGAAEATAGSPRDSGCSMHGSKPNPSPIGALATLGLALALLRRRAVVVFGIAGSLGEGDALNPIGRRSAGRGAARPA